jgi:hypothetical protein
MGNAVRLMGRGRAARDKREAEKMKSRVEEKKKKN